jgi:hypothetical protein
MGVQGLRWLNCLLALNPDVCSPACLDALTMEPLTDSFHNDLKQRQHRCFRSPENGED